MKYGVKKHGVKPIESLTPGQDWYEVTDLENEFRLWIVSADQRSSALACTCEAPRWCAHRAAVANEIEYDEARMDAADRLDFSRGQF